MTDRDAWIAKPQPTAELCRLYHGIDCRRGCGPVVVITYSTAPLTVDQSVLKALRHRPIFDEKEALDIAIARVCGRYLTSCERPSGHAGDCQPYAIRGVDFACEECGKLEGFFLERGFHRCRACGYPSQ